MEADIAALVGVDSRDLVVVFNSGMAAVRDCIDLAMHETSTGERQTVLYSSELYSETDERIFNYVREITGAKVLTFEPGDTESFERKLITHEPNVIVAETVANFRGSSMLDVDHFRKTVAEHAPEAISVLDNTLPLSTALPLGEMLRPEERIVVVESGTKAFAMNGELAGHAYSRNVPLVHAIRNYQRNGGSVPGTGSLDRLQELLPKTRQEFDERNKQIFAKASELAAYLYEAQEAGGDFTIQHPSLPSHLQYEYAQTHYPDGASPVLFVGLTNMAADQYEYGRQIAEDPVVRQYSEIGHSFGLDQARILASRINAVIRIAAGAETDTEKLGPALRDAAIKITKT